MKKQLLALAVLALAAGTASAQLNDTLAKIKSSGTVNLGVRDSSGLGFTIGGGKYVGFHTEMAERIVDDLKKVVGGDLKINYQVITSQNRIPLLQNGTIEYRKSRYALASAAVPFFCTVRSTTATGFSVTMLALG